MNIATAMDLYAGGPGSGCKGSNCGRKSTGATKVLSDRAKRALMTYVPMTAGKLAIAKQNEFKLARLVGGTAFKDNGPFDVIVNGKIGIELKTMFPGVNDKITIHPESRRRKEAFAAQQKMKKIFTVAFDQRGKKPVFYWKGGVGAFRLKNMTQAGSLQELRKAIIGK